MQKNSSEKPTGPNKAVKYILLAFVAVSIAAAAYKAFAPCCGGEEPIAATAAAPEQTPAAPAETSSPAAVKKAPAPVKTALAAPKQAAVPAKSAVVYYFYTTARCYSCKMIEEYTLEAVEKRFAEPYKGWRVEFRGVNVDLPANSHFIQDYWLNSKSVVVQPFAGDKPLKWGKLDKVWTLLGDKPAFINYVAEETQKLLNQQ